MFGEVLPMSSCTGIEEFQEALGQFIVHRLLYNKQIAHHYATGKGFKEGLYNKIIV